MKKIVFGFVLLSTLAMKASAGAPAVPAPERAPIMRKMKAIGRVMKFALKFNGDGVDLKNEEICHFESEVPVYDLRTKGPAFDFVKIGECKSDLKGKPVRVIVQGYAAHTYWRSNDKSETEAKIAQAVLTVRGDGVDAGVQDLNGYQGTKDLRSSSFLLFLSQEDRAGQSPEREDFTVAIELQDN